MRLDKQTDIILPPNADNDTITDHAYLALNLLYKNWWILHTFEDNQRGNASLYPPPCNTQLRV